MVERPMVKIEPLTERFLPEAIELVDRVFPSQSPLERLSLRLYSAKDRSWFSWLARLLGIQDIHFWVAVTTQPHQVVGTTGLYSCVHDATEAYWLGWFCVHPRWRGHGVGSQLLEFTIAEATKAGKRRLRLYTSTDPNEAAAQVVYEKRGFRLAGEKQPWLWRFWNIRLLYRELEL